jgi:hypothetical protein
MIELYEDYFESHPEAQVRRMVHGPSGTSYFQTGDPTVDRWEREIADGLEPDYDEGMTAEQREMESRHARALRALEDETAGFAGFEERFDR